MATFDGDKDPILRYTWYIEPNARLFADSSWAHYFSLTAELVGKRQIRSAKAVLILDDGCDLDDEKCRALVGFFHSMPNYACSVITEANYDAIRRDRDFAGKNFIEFGVYGTRLLFLSQDYVTRSDGSQKIEGTFHKDSETIREFAEGFDAIFDSPLVVTDLKGADRPKEKVALAELVKL